MIPTTISRLQISNSEFTMGNQSSDLTDQSTFDEIKTAWQGLTTKRARLAFLDVAVPDALATRASMQNTTETGELLFERKSTIPEETFRVANNNYDTLLTERATLMSYIESVDAQVRRLTPEQLCMLDA